jgi:hypothetical protein
MTITRNSVTGQNRIDWNTDGVSLYELRYGYNLANQSNWTLLVFGTDLGTFNHTPAGDREGFYRVFRFDD